MTISKKLIVGATVLAVAGGVTARMTIFNEGEGPAGEGVKMIMPASSVGAIQHKNTNDDGKGH